MKGKRSGGEGKRDGVKESEEGGGKRGKEGKEMKE